LHHSLTKDPFWTVFTGGSWVVIFTFWIRRHRFEFKTKTPKAIHRVCFARLGRRV
jgi:hypothetical protein